MNIFLDLTMDILWRPSLESWGLPRYYSKHTVLPADMDLGPVALGRVHGTEAVALAGALNRVLANAVSAALPVPRRALAAVAGNAVRAQDTLGVSPEQPLRLDVPVAVRASLGHSATEPALAARENQSVQPYSFLLDGADAVLKIDSPHYQGTLVGDKLAMRITTPVPAGLDVIPAGADLGGHETLLHEGRRISAGDLAALAMAGVRELTVFKRPLVAVCVLHKYYLPEQALEQPDTSGMPDALSPMVLALLARWGVTVDTVCHLDFGGHPVGDHRTHEINAISDEHDLTIVLGFLGNDAEMDSIRTRASLPDIQEPPVDAEFKDVNYSRHRAQVRPADQARVGTVAAYGSGKTRPGRCSLLISLQGLPLPVLTSMYTTVKPVIEALAGVGAFPVLPSNPLGFAAPIKGKDFANDRRGLLSRPLAGMSGRHGVRWLPGILAAPAPRDPDRHWLQLARIERDASGQTALRVLPSEEHQVSGLIGAEAMVGIAQGEGELAAGSAVEYFLLD